MSSVEHFKTFCQKIYRKSGRLHDTKSMGWPELSEQRRDSESSGLLTSLYWQFKKSIDRWIGQTWVQVERALGRWVDGGRARRILNTILRQNTRPSVSYQINGGKEEAACSEWPGWKTIAHNGYEITIAGARRSTTWHVYTTRTFIYRQFVLPGPLFTALVGGQRERERERQREKGREGERETVGPVIISSSKHDRTPDIVVTSNSIGRP